MRSFLSFLTEKLFDGIEVNDRYIEIFVDPLTSELMSAGKVATKDIKDILPGRVLELGYGKCYYVGAMLSLKHLYIINRAQAQHADVLRAIKPKGDGPFTPLYLYYFPEVNKIVVQVALWSLQNASENEGYKRASKSPVLRKLVKTLIDWDTLKPLK
jgi:hypothetical protein